MKHLLVHFIFNISVDCEQFRGGMAGEGCTGWRSWRGDAPEQFDTLLTTLAHSEVGHRQSSGGNVTSIFFNWLIKLGGHNGVSFERVGPSAKMFGNQWEPHRSYDHMIQWSNVAKNPWELTWICSRIFYNLEEFKHLRVHMYFGAFVNTRSYCLMWKPLTKMIGLFCSY